MRHFKGYFLFQFIPPIWLTESAFMPHLLQKWYIKEETKIKSFF
jgi:hypothetical protein